MAQTGLEFLENRSWSSDHASIIFSAWLEGRELRFFLPRTSMHVLCPTLEQLSDFDCLRLFDAHRTKLITIAQLVYEHDRGINSAYVIADLAIQENLPAIRAISPQLAA